MPGLPLMISRVMIRWTCFSLALWAAVVHPVEAARPGGGPPGNAALSGATQQMDRVSSAGATVAPGNQPSQEDLILNLMRPERVDQIDLSPDGRHVAYVAVEKYSVRLIIIDLDHLESPVSVPVGEGSWWKQVTGGNWSAPHVTFLRWATARRLVFAEGGNAIYAVNSDGKGLTKLVQDTDVAIPKGQDLTVLADSTAPGMAIQLNQLDMMAGSPATNLDPALRVAGQPDNGPVTTLGANAQNLSMAGGSSNSYISNGAPDRATDPTAVLGGANPTDLPDATLPRSPRVVAMPPEDPGHIIVEASGVQNPLSGLYPYGLFRVDIETGARVSLGEGALSGHQVLYDRAGHLRVVLGAVSRTYLHVFPGRAVWRGAKPLDKIVRDPASRGFEAVPETFFGARAVPIGFDYDPNILYFASNLGRDTMGVYALNVKSGERTAFAVENPDADVVDPGLRGELDPGADPLVFDPHLRRLVGVRLAGPRPSTRWIDSDLSRIQARLEDKFPDRTVEILNWDAGRTRFLALVAGRTDPGRYYVYAPAGEQLVLCARRAPWIAEREYLPGVAAFLCRRRRDRTQGQRDRGPQFAHSPGAACRSLSGRTRPARVSRL